jgi:hypothetical protein
MAIDYRVRSADDRRALPAASSLPLTHAADRRYRRTQFGFVTATELKEALLSRVRS